MSESDNPDDISDKDRLSQTGKAIGYMLAQKGWTQKELAAKSGLHAVHVSNIIQGRSKGTMKTLSKLSSAMGSNVFEVYRVAEAIEAGSLERYQLNKDRPPRKPDPAFAPSELPMTSLDLSGNQGPLFDKIIDLVAENAVLKERIHILEAKLKDISDKKKSRSKRNQS